MLGFRELGVVSGMDVCGCSCTGDTCVSRNVEPPVQRKGLFQKEFGVANVKGIVLFKGVDVKGILFLWNFGLPVYMGVVFQRICGLLV